MLPLQTTTDAFNVWSLKQWRIQDLTWGAWTLSSGVGVRKPLKVLAVEESVLVCFGHISIKIRLKMNRERNK